MTYKTNWLRGILGPMLVSCSFAAAALPNKIAASQWHTVFVDNGAVFAMGSNLRGEIAPGTGSGFTTPYFTGILNAKYVSANYYRTAVLKNDGTATLLGINWSKNAADVARPVPGSNITDIALTQKDVFYISGGQVYRWTEGTSPVALPGSSGAVQVAGGLGHAVILFSSGQVGTFGSNGRGQLGDGTKVSSTTIKMLPVSGVVEIATGDNITMLRLSNGQVIGFGANTQNQLGLGTATDVVTPTVLPITGVKKLMAGITHSAVIKTDGTVWASGWHNYIDGALYNTNPTFVKMPVGTVVDATVGGDQTVLQSGKVGQLAGWGGNIYGKLGDGTSTERHQVSLAYFTPVAPPAPVVTAPAPAPVVTASSTTTTSAQAPAPTTDAVCKQYASASMTPFGKLPDFSTALRCGIVIYDSMNACIKANPGVNGIGELCKSVIPPADRGQQEKAPTTTPATTGKK